MSELAASLLDFYKRHGISPVRQDISDLPKHFTRRAALYRHLGILPAFVTGRTVAEIGPGSGFNSVYTATLKPSRFVLVEGNPRGVEDIEQLFARFGSLRSSIDIVSAPVEEYEPGELFDFVFCEGMLALAGVPDPIALLRRVARLVAPGGVLVITCIDAVSYFAETLRRLLADRLADPGAPLQSRVDRLMPAFHQHLSTIRGMTRPHEDWIIDNLINPASIGPLLPIPDAVDALDDGFDVFGASPQFARDWRWYKHITSDRDFNRPALEQYWATVHNLLDYREVFPERSGQDNRAMYAQCHAVRELIRRFEHTGDASALDAICVELDAVTRAVDASSAPVAAALREVGTLLHQPSLEPDDVAGSRAFAGWFGRGQQYVSFSRRAE
jgi:SAM-dependent methyltransferase